MLTMLQFLFTAGEPVKYASSGNLRARSLRVARAISPDARSGILPPLTPCERRFGILPALVRKAGSIGTGNPELHQKWPRASCPRDSRGIVTGFDGQDARRHSLFGGHHAVDLLGDLAMVPRAYHVSGQTEPL